MKTYEFRVTTVATVRLLAKSPKEAETMWGTFETAYTDLVRAGMYVGDDIPTDVVVSRVDTRIEHLRVVK